MLADSLRSLATGASWSGGERNHLFLGNEKTNDFVRVSGISGLDDPGDSRGFALLDLDRDGWLDVAQLNLSAPRVRLLRNRIGERPTTRHNGFVALRFVGGNRTAQPSKEWSSRDGFGATVELLLAGGTTIYREHRTEDGYMTQHSSTLLIGIGTHGRVETMTICWPSGRKQTAAGVASGSLVTAHEDASASPAGRAIRISSYRKNQ